MSHLIVAQSRVNLAEDRVKKAAGNVTKAKDNQAEAEKAQKMALKSGNPLVMETAETNAQVAKKELQDAIDEWQDANKALRLRQADAKKAVSTVHRPQPREQNKAAHERGGSFHYINFKQKGRKPYRSEPTREQFFESPPKQMMHATKGILKLHHHQKKIEKRMSPSKTERRFQFRQNWASAYGIYRPQQNHVKCCVSGKWGNSSDVVGAHILPLNTDQSVVSNFNMEGKLHDVRNIIPLSRKIQKAFDEQKICFVLDNGDVAEPLYRMKILAPWLKNEIVHKGMLTTFECLTHQTFELPTLKDGTGPFTRILSHHAQTSHDLAVRYGWIWRTEKRPELYGSPLDCDILSFVPKTPGGSNKDDGDVDDLDDFDFDAW